MAGSAARVVRTAAIRSSSIVARQSASVMDKNPPVRAGAPPTLLTRTSIRSPACPIRLAGPAGSARSASTTRTWPARASSSRPAEDSLAPTVTRAPAAASPRTMARPIRGRLPGRRGRPGAAGARRRRPVVPGFARTSGTAAGGRRGEDGDEVAGPAGEVLGGRAHLAGDGGGERAARGTGGRELDPFRVDV